MADSSQRWHLWSQHFWTNQIHGKLISSFFRVRTFSLHLLYPVSLVIASYISFGTFVAFSKILDSSAGGCGDQTRSFALKLAFVGGLGRCPFVQHSAAFVDSANSKVSCWPRYWLFIGLGASSLLDCSGAGLSVCFWQ